MYDVCLWVYARISAASADVHGLLSNVKDTNKMSENLSFHIWEYLLNSLYM